MDFSKSLPANILNFLDVSTAEQIHVGMSKSDVFRIQGKNGEGCYLKITQSPYVMAEIKQEMRLCEWLRPRGIITPTPLFLEEHQNKTYFLMSEVKGTSLADLAERIGEAESMRRGARYLKRLHSIDISECPFERTLKTTLKLAGENLDQGLVDEHELDLSHQGKSGVVLLEELKVSAPGAEDLVFTHGDFCFPNLICDNKDVTGIIDFGRAGIADRYQDLALFLRSFEFNLSEPNRALFLKEYGLISEYDESKAAFYRKLDEFF